MLAAALRLHLACYVSGKIRIWTRFPFQQSCLIFSLPNSSTENNLTVILRYKVTWRFQILEIYWLDKYRMYAVYVACTSKVWKYTNISIFTSPLPFYLFCVETFCFNDLLFFGILIWNSIQALILMSAILSCRASTEKVQKSHMHWRQSTTTVICIVVPTDESQRTLRYVHISIN